jgi:NAD(P)-dependent dehydrogenase (short-subunit alcohol dehydrogenase family)
MALGWRRQKLDVLVNNAGAMYGTRQVTKDGIELTWAVNHLAVESRRAAYAQSKQARTAE